MNDFKPGEVVDITIKGARIARNGQDDLGRAFVEYTHGECNALATVDRDDPAVNIARVAPAEWPPQVGDLWRDQYGDLWFANEGHDADGGTYVDLHCSISKVTEAWGSQIGFSVNREYGPLTLVHREDEQAGGAL